MYQKCPTADPMKELVQHMWPQQLFSKFHMSYHQSEALNVELGETEHMVFLELVTVIVVLFRGCLATHMVAHQKHTQSHRARI